jgi:hypothetical protein
VGLFFWLSHQHSTCIPLLPCLSCMLCSVNLPWLDHSNYTWWREKVMKPLIVQFSPTSHHFISLQSKYSPQQPILKPPQSMFLLLVFLWFYATRKIVLTLLYWDWLKLYRKTPYIFWHNRPMREVIKIRNLKERDCTTVAERCRVFPPLPSLRVVPRVARLRSNYLVAQQ